MNGVIETTTGDLLRAGFCDFSGDGSFDPATETCIGDDEANALLSRTYRDPFAVPRIV